MVELLSPTLVSRYDIPVISKAVDFKIPELQRQYVSYGNKLLPENLANHLLSCKITNKDRIIS